MTKIKYSLALVVSLACIGCFFLFTGMEQQKIVEKEIEYASDAASEVVMVWGINYLQLPPREFWPEGSFLRDDLVHTSTKKANGKFIVKLSLPNNTVLNYWMVHLKDKKGNATEVWDSGGPDKNHYLVIFSSNGLFRPGYFIFLAGFLPLAIVYYNNRKKKIVRINDDLFKVKNYIPQFDSLRAIAVLLVLCHHWFEKSSFFSFLKSGPLGVNIFFVLSGFLITAILLKSRKQVEDKTLGRATAFKNFYIRRTLRIFPIYYLLLFIFLFFNDAELKENAVYYFSYTANYLYYSEQFFSAHFAHLWSLAVEEQFYLFWPWLVVLISRRLLPYLIGLLLVIGVSSNYIFTDHGWWVQILTPACFDAFAIGGMLAYLIAYRQDIIQQIQPVYNYVFYGATTLFILNLCGYSILPTRTVQALFALTLLYYCLFKNNNKIANYILNNKGLIQLGKISYGIYLYHLFVPEVWSWMIKKFASYNVDLFFNGAMPEALKPAWLFLQEFSFLILICVISWRLIEKPINSLKKLFEHKVETKKLSTDLRPAEQKIIVTEKVG